MDITSIPIEGASGGAVAMIIYALTQAVRRKLNNNKAPLPCIAHAERLSVLEKTCQGLADLIVRIESQARAVHKQDSDARAAVVVIMTEQGKELATLQANVTSMAEGIIRIGLTVTEIEKVLRK